MSVHSKTIEGAKGADACGTKRVGETKAVVFPPWLNTLPILGQLKTRRPVASTA